jgi:DNA topoisomerase-1
LRRVKTVRGLQYFTTSGRRVVNPSTLRRIAQLAIPPAWTEVWICSNPRGHLQATGRDARGRKQHRYHPRWAAVRDAAKFDRMLAFGRRLPQLRQHLRCDLAHPGVGRDKVLAAVIALLEKTLIRVGNDEYARQNGSIGLTTMRDRNVTVSGAELRFSFRGKSGILHVVGLHDRRLARIVRTCQELPGQELFQYVDELGNLRRITSGDVNQYLRRVMGDDFTAKDFRTWAATLLAAAALQARGPARTLGKSKGGIKDAIAEVARRLGNTPTVCRNCYVHPALLEAYERGQFPRRRKTEGRANASRLAAERTVIALLSSAKHRSANDKAAHALRISRT